MRTAYAMIVLASSLCATAADPIRIYVPNPPKLSEADRNNPRYVFRRCDVKWDELCSDTNTIAVYTNLDKPAALDLLRSIKPASGSIPSVTTDGRITILRWEGGGLGRSLFYERVGGAWKHVWTMLDPNA